MLYSYLSVVGKMRRYLNFEVFYYMHLLTVDIKTYWIHMQIKNIIGYILPFIKHLIVNKHNFL